jgi:hypothetical protein
MNLTSAGVTINKQLARRLTQIAIHYGCEFAGKRMQRRCSSNQIAIAAAMVANASRSVGDQVLEIRRQTESDFRIAVADKLRSLAGSRIRENQSIKGKSGRSYRMPHLVLDRSEARAIAFVVALPNRNLVLSHFGEFWDIKGAFPDVANDSIYDENSDFKDEDRRLLEQVSNVFAFSQSNRRISELLATG